MLVIPESKYAKKVPVTLGTLHIDEIIGLVTNEELATWHRFEKDSHQNSAAKRKQDSFG